MTLFTVLRVSRLSLCFAIPALLAGCISQPTRDESANLTTEAAQYGFVDISDIKANMPPATQLRSLLLQRKPRAETLTIYIEDDSPAWISPEEPPKDPTPTKPIVFALALADPTQAVAYLSRPCQYLKPEQLAQCPAHFWTSKRYSPEVIALMNNAINALKAKSGAWRIRLVGYGGGGVMASMLASERGDVGAFLTIASPLKPLQVANKRLPPAMHYVGGLDLKVPETYAAEFVSQLGGKLSIVTEYDHECCWPSAWARLQAALP